ncbi:MAG: hypothetical protein VX589_00135 [Myxococcota bacterium]|nr:hypothetical protein [Myxococcota bacterium]
MTEASAQTRAVTQFLRRLASVPEMSMRVHLWAGFASEAHPTTVLTAVEAVLAGLTTRTTAARLGMMALARWMTDDGEGVRKVLLPAAVAGRSTVVMTLLADDPPARIAELSALPVPAISNDREVTLGERRAMARGHDRMILERLFTDPDHRVIRHLLINPRIRETDVLNIASRRPVGQAVLLEVFRQDRWIASPRVREALVQNPYCPVPIALALITVLDEPGLRQVIAARAVHPLVRSSARALLRRRKSMGAMTIDDGQLAWIENLLKDRDAADHKQVD